MRHEAIQTRLTEIAELSPLSLPTRRAFNDRRAAVCPCQWHCVARMECFGVALVWEWTCLLSHSNGRRCLWPRRTHHHNPPNIPSYPDPPVGRYGTCMCPLKLPPRLRFLISRSTPMRSSASVANNAGFGQRG